ncbi:hypothetical protein [Serratia phage SMP]|uniref:Transmembrane protein n=1 Tax=Serratia phage SMP TaxID=2982904 RepID=A0A9E8JWW3_9CAUD|nr:hypothetical protein [Serratia phage SMP]
MGGFVVWAHEWYLVMLIASFGCVLFELFIIDRLRGDPKSHWRFWLVVNGWPLIFSVLFIFGAIGVWIYSWLVLF